VINELHQQHKKIEVAINQYQQNAIEASNSAACGAFMVPFQIHTGGFL